MKIRNIALALTLTFTALPTFAQYENLDSSIDLTNDEVRYRVAYIGTEPAEDPSKLVGGYVTMLQMYYNSQNWAEMYDNWKWLIKNTPIATVTLYARGAWMLYNLIKTETDVEKKKVYLADLMNLFDTRMKYLKYLNADMVLTLNTPTTKSTTCMPKASRLSTKKVAAR